MRSVRKERTGWRDLGWNLRQRCHGYDVPFCDVDCLAYEDRTPVALLEDVNEKGALKKPRKDSGIIAVKDLAHRAGMPFFGRRIASNFSWIVISPLNRFARGWEPKQGFGQKLTEAEYVVWRYSLGGRKLGIKDAQTIIDVGVAQGLDKPEIRSFMFSNMDDAGAIDRDLEKLDALDLIKIMSAINRRLGGVKT